jgi:hypothetical protein
MTGFGRKRLLLILLFTGLGVITFYPWKTTVVPEWKVRIVDQNGAPLTNTGVREVWQHYSIESGSHEQDLPTDKQGYVTFPERAIRSPLAVRIIRPIINALNPHHSSGPDGFVIVLAGEYDTWSNNSALPGQPLPKEVIVKKNR